MNEQNDHLLSLLPKAVRPPKLTQTLVSQHIGSLDIIRPNGPPDHPYIGPTWYLMAAYRGNEIPITASGISDVINELELLMQITAEMKPHLNPLNWEQRSPTVLAKAFHHLDAR